MREKKEDNKNIIAFMAAVLAVVLFLFSCLGFSIWEEYKKTIIDNQKKQMLLTAQSLGDNLEIFIEEYEADLDSLCTMEAGNRRKGGHGKWEIIQEYVDSHSRFVYDVIVSDPQGAVLKSTKGFKVTQTYSVTEIDEALSFRQCRLDDGEIYLILRRELERGGSISIVIDAINYYQSLISGIRLGTNGYVVVKDSDGIILMHPEKKQWGIDVIDGRQEMYPDKDLSSLDQMVESQKKGEEGVLEYYSYWWTKPGAPRVKKISAYAPAIIGDGFLVISAVIDYNDIYIPVVEGFTKLALVFVGIMAAILLMALYMAKLIKQKKHDTEEIAYLLELNQILESMHQSEERIAHQQRLQIMGTMTGGIAHEFNNLLTPIMGYADLMMMELPEDSELYDSASEIYEASAKAKEIIQQISSLSRKNMETAYKHLNAAKIFRRALKMVQSVCPVNIKLTDELELSQECFLGNETQMNQVILNICVNAIHAIGHQEGTIKVSGRTAQAGELKQYGLSSVPGDWRQYIRLDISDNGCGMPDEILKQIFDPFFTTKKGGKGTGLGLALVEQIISSHKGYIFAESHPGEGSIFHIYLPVNEQKDGDEPDGELECNEAGEKLLNLLIVDDNPKVLKLLEKDFGRLGIAVTACMSYEEARNHLRGREFDAMAAEQSIGGRSAVDFCMSIQGQCPGLQRIIMTEQVTKEVLEAKQRKIIDDYIDKPVSASSILKAIRTIQTLN